MIFLSFDNSWSLIESFIPYIDIYFKSFLFPSTINAAFFSFSSFKNFYNSIRADSSLSSSFISKTNTKAYV